MTFEKWFTCKTINHVNYFLFWKKINKIQNVIYNFAQKVQGDNLKNRYHANKKLFFYYCCLIKANESQKNKDILVRHFYDMSNMMLKNEDAWLSNGWVKTLLGIFFPSFLYTVISIVYFEASYIDKWQAPSTLIFTKIWVEGVVICFIICSFLHLPHFHPYNVSCLWMCI